MVGLFQIAIGCGVLQDYPWPDFFSESCYEDITEHVKELHRENLAVAGSVGSIFENAFALRELQNLLVGFLENEDIATALLNKLTSIRCHMAKKYAEANVDLLYTWDDTGMQDRMLMSPEIWRKWLKPRLAKVIKSARDITPDIHVFYHSDGRIEEVIPDLIEVGVTVLNPIQPECMDPVKLKKLYGDRLAFWGTIGTQSTMPFGTPSEIRRVVKERIETIGKGGGLILAPTHVLEPDVPWENIIAFFDS